MIKLKNIGILGAFAISSYAGGDIVTPTEPFVEIPMQKTNSDTFNNTFVYIAGGMSFLNVEATVNVPTTFIDGAFDDDGSIIEVGLGYRYSSNIFATLSAQRTMLDLVDIDNFYASINYQFSNVMAKPYVGLVGGYSKLTWNDRPHVMLINEDLTSDGMMYGLQVGFEESLNSSWSVIGKYQFLNYDHLMDIRSLSSVIEHNSGQNLLVGIQYEF